MGLLSKTWNRVKEAFSEPDRSAPDDLELPDPTPVPTAGVFREMRSVEEAVFPIPETAPVVATESNITVGKPLRLKTSKAQFIA